MLLEQLKRIRWRSSLVQALTRKGIEETGEDELQKERGAVSSREALVSRPKDEKNAILTGK